MKSKSINLIQRNKINLINQNKNNLIKRNPNTIKQFNRFIGFFLLIQSEIQLIYGSIKIKTGSVLLVLFLVVL